MIDLLTSLRRFLATVLEITQVRLELLGTEIELEKRRLFDALIRVVLATVMLGIGMLVLCGFVILLFWDSHRLLAAGIMALFFLGAGGLLLYQARSYLRNPKGLFGNSAIELERDRASLLNEDQRE